MRSPTSSTRVGTCSQTRVSGPGATPWPPVAAGGRRASSARVRPGRFAIEMAETDGSDAMSGQHGWPVADGVLSLGDLPVERGGVIGDARLAWQAHGTLNDARDNVIVYPCSYTASHDDQSWLIGPDAV